MAILDYDASFSLVGIFGTLDRPTDYAPNTGKVTVGLGAGSVATEPVTSAPRAASAAARREGWASLRIRTP
jgi:hypothetical protein